MDHVKMNKHEIIQQVFFDHTPLLHYHFQSLQDRESFLKVLSTVNKNVNPHVKRWLFYNCPHVWKIVLEELPGILEMELKSKNYDAIQMYHWRCYRYLYSIYDRPRKGHKFKKLYLDMCSVFILNHFPYKNVDMLDDLIKSRYDRLYCHKQRVCKLLKHCFVFELSQHISYWDDNILQIINKYICFELP
jgi:hypothetical protein